METLKQSEMSRKLPIPSRSKARTFFESEELKQKLSNEAGVEMLLAVIAWKIEEKQKKFVKLQPEGLRCSRDGITTEP
jgi:hypothetical protein